jgi:methionine-rich copper-binding protein CopC
MNKESAVPMKLTTRRAMLAAMVLLLPLFATKNATAHALLDRAEPRVGNTVATAPSEVTLWFTQKLEASFSSVTVTNAAGKRVDTGKLRVSGNQMSVSLTPGGTGTYRVIWRVLSVDAHRTDGSFSFRVGQ